MRQFFLKIIIIMKDNLLVEIICFYCSYDLFIPNYTIMTYDNNAKNICLMKWIVTYSQTQCRPHTPLICCILARPQQTSGNQHKRVLPPMSSMHCQDTLLTLLCFAASKSN